MTERVLGNCKLRTLMFHLFYFYYHKYCIFTLPLLKAPKFLIKNIELTNYCMMKCIPNISSSILLPIPPYRILLSCCRKNSSFDDVRNGDSNNGTACSHENVIRHTRNPTFRIPSYTKCKQKSFFAI